MIRKDDVKWWVLEAKKHPESVATIIEELAGRLSELDAENERLRDEIVQLQRHPTAAVGGAEVSALQDKVATLQALLAGNASSKPSAVFISDRLQPARLPLPQARQLAREGDPVLNQPAMLRLRCMLLARPHDELLLFTSQGRSFKLSPTDVPALAGGKDWPAVEVPNLANGERLTAAVAVTQPPRFWTIVTRRGYVRQFLHVELDMKLTQGKQLIESLSRNDAPVAAVNGDRGDLLVITRWGKGVRFPQRAIAASGSTTLALEPDDEVVAALSLPSDTTILIVTASGYAARRDMAHFAARSSPGGAGKPLIQAFDVLGTFPFDPDAQLLYLTYSGKLVLVPAADVPLHQRSSKGARVHVFDRDPAVAVTLIPAQVRRT